MIPQLQFHSYKDLLRPAEISMKDIVENIPLERAVKMVYIPVILTRAAIEYAEVACSLCAEKKLNFKKEVRIIREQIKELEKHTAYVLGDCIVDLEGKTDEFFDEADQHIENLHRAIKMQMMKCWPEIKDYSLLLNLYMCVILIDFVERFDIASSQEIKKRCKVTNAYFRISDMRDIRKACLSIAGARLPNNDMIKLGIKVLAVNIEKMIKVDIVK